MRWNLIHDKSKDGISAHLFPLTSKDQADYAFRMVGRERLNGRDVFHITFRPKKKDDFGWSGDAYIDTAAYEPVLITTAMARKIPFAVRTLAGDQFARSRLHRDLRAAARWRLVPRHVLHRIQNSTYCSSFTARSFSTRRTANSRRPT